jgi:hypothetical protein
VVFYALATADSEFAVDLYPSLEAARIELTKILRDEPSFELMLRIVPIRLDSPATVNESPAPEWFETSAREERNR